MTVKHSNMEWIFFSILSKMLVIFFEYSYDDNASVV